MEFALILPFLAVMVFGVIDYGFAYRQENQLQGSLASAGRVVSQIGNQNQSGRADYAALKSIESAISGMKNTRLVKVVIWKANTLTGPQCLGVATATSSPAGTADLCNVYSREQVLDPNSLSHYQSTSKLATTCPVTSWDKNWCPLGRNDEDKTADLIGVYVEVEYTSFTKVVTSKPIRMSDWTVYRVEPQY